MEPKPSDKKEFKAVNFLFTLTVIQFWWIAIWGIAYIFIGLIAGKSKIIEMTLYLGMLVITAAIIHKNPTLLQHL
jgi:hypothetical protein